MELLLLLAFCLLVALGCFGAIGWVLLSGMELGVERIFLIIVCSVLGFLFLGIAGWIVSKSPVPTTAQSEAAPQPAKAATAKQQKAPEEVSKTTS
jgi:hypothetical protein